MRWSLRTNFFITLVVAALVAVATYLADLKVGAGERFGQVTVDGVEISFCIRFEERLISGNRWNVGFISASQPVGALKVGSVFPSWGSKHVTPFYGISSNGGCKYLASLEAKRLDESFASEESHRVKSSLARIFIDEGLIEALLKYENEGSLQ